jgi:diguanylate cyclase (GGDEF)-like protein
MDVRSTPGIRSAPALDGGASGEPSWIAACAASSRESFDRVTRLAARALDVPLAVFAFLHEDRGVIEETFGLRQSRRRAEHALYEACLAAPDGRLVVPDAAADSRLRAIPVVDGPPYVRFFAGVVVHAPDRSPVGVLGVLDTRPRELSPEHLAILEETRSVCEEMLLLIGWSAQDRLTRLLSRGSFDDALRREWRRAMRDGAPLSAVIVDVDHFKAYNDRYGHPAGDIVLRDVATVLRQQFRRPGDLAFRYGGEEFVVLLPGTPGAAAQRLATQAVRAMAKQRIQHDGSPSGLVTISAGVATASPTRASHEPTALLVAADRNLYVAKRSGRNTVATGPRSPSRAAPPVQARLPG